jgi:hypothetical protein
MFGHQKVLRICCAKQSRSQQETFGRFGRIAIEFDAPNWLAAESVSAQWLPPRSINENASSMPIPKCE